MFPRAFAPGERCHLPMFLVLVSVAVTACSPVSLRVVEPGRALSGLYRADLEGTRDRVLSWRMPRAASELRGLRLLYDTPVPGRPSLAVVRSVVRANHRLAPFDALLLATRAVQSAREHHLAYGFFAATLLQESAFAPGALSPAGAVGIGQFTLDTAAEAGIDPFDWEAAMGASAALLGRYVRAYDGRYADPYAAALAAYNAGPGTVEYYKGVPPYPETRAYVADVYDRWSRILHDAGAGGRRERTPAGLGKAPQPALGRWPKRGMTVQP